MTELHQAIMLQIEVQQQQRQLHQIQHQEQ
jgi:hypothetical protein